ncbi:MAG: hypothetical protein U0T77_06595 [Chitinophagales bacterium]
MTTANNIALVLLLALSVTLPGNSIAQSNGKLPRKVFFQLIDSTETMELNDAVKFAHVNLPQKYFNTFLSYIKDSAATEIPGLASPVYYSWQLKNGQIINGDVYWKENTGYIVFKLDNKKYINSFAREGIAQLKSLFKIQP